MSGLRVFLVVLIAVLAACGSSAKKPATQSPTSTAPAQPVAALASATVAVPPSTPTPVRTATAQPVSTAPVAGGCPVDFPVKGTAAKQAFAPDNPDYDRATPEICFVSLATAVRAGFAPAPTPTVPPPAPPTPSPSPTRAPTRAPTTTTQAPTAPPPSATAARRPQFNPATYSCSGIRQPHALPGDWQVSSSSDAAPVGSGVQLGLRNKSGTSSQTYYVLATVFAPDGSVSASGPSITISGADWLFLQYPDDFDQDGRPARNDLPGIYTVEWTVGPLDVACYGFILR